MISSLTSTQDTIKVRMQLSRRAQRPGVGIPSHENRSDVSNSIQVKRRGFLMTGKEIIKRETPLALYKGLGAVMAGIVPKMAIRFTSYEWYKQLLADKNTGAVSGQVTFFGELSMVIRLISFWSDQPSIKSRPGCWHYRSRRRCHSNGGREDPFTVPVSFHV